MMPDPERRPWCHSAALNTVSLSDPQVSAQRLPLALPRCQGRSANHFIIYFYFTKIKKNKKSFLFFCGTNETNFT